MVWEKNDNRNNFFPEALQGQDRVQSCSPVNTEVQLLIAGMQARPKKGGDIGRFVKPHFNCMNIELNILIIVNGLSYFS